MSRLVLANVSVATRRRVYFQLVGADGITPATGEAGGQPQISTNGAAFVDAGIGTLNHIGNGRYYADCTMAAVATAGDVIETRYKSVNTAECPGDTLQIVGFDPANADSLGLANLNATVGSRAMPSDIPTDYQQRGVDVTLPGGLATSANQAAILNAIGNLHNLSTADIEAVLQGLGVSTLTAEQVRIEMDASSTRLEYIAGALATASITTISRNVVAGRLVIYPTEQLAFNLTGLGAVGASNIVFTVKNKVTDSDAQALIQITRAGGLLVIAGAPPSVSTGGSLTISDVSAGAGTVTLSPTETAKLISATLNSDRGVVFDVRVLESVPRTALEGTGKVDFTVTRKIT